VDSAETAVRLTNVGGSFELGRDAGTEPVGTISRLSGRAVEVSNVAAISINGLQFIDVDSDALNLRNFGQIRLTNLQIVDVAGTAVVASTGGLIEVLSNSITNARAGIEIYEVDQVMLADNQIFETDTTAVIVSNAAGGGANAQVRKSAAGDMNVQIIGNEIMTGADDGLMVSSSDLGVYLLELRDNHSDSSENDFVFSAIEPAVLMLSGFAGGDSDAVGMYVGRTNVGFPSVEVVGTVGAGPAGQADIAAIEKSVSDPEPLPEREIEYRIAVTNLGPAPAFAVTVVDSLPDGLGYVTGSIRIDGAEMTDDDDEDAADFGQTRAGSITARLGDMSATDTTIVTFLARPRQASAGVSVTNAAVVEALSPDSIDANNRAQVEITIKLNTATESSDFPEFFALRQNYPNPFNPITTIAFDLPAREFVRLTVHNVLGQPVAQLVSAPLEAGRYSVNWDARRNGGAPAGSGMYFYTLEAGSHVATRSMILLK
ncbi:MAG TPA: T9SS type A sorting domain-containing protein, partial [Rhodothermia bacterium]